MPAPGFPVVSRATLFCCAPACDAFHPPASVRSREGRMAAGGSGPDFSPHMHDHTAAPLALRIFPAGSTRPCRCIASILGATLFAMLAFSLRAEPKVDTTLLAPANAISVHVTPNGRVSAVVRQGSRVVVTIDGEAGPRFDRFLAASGSPMLGRTQFAALNNRDASDHPVMFSDDGSRYGYIGLQGQEYVVIVDGKEVHRAPYEAGSVYALGRTIHFSPQGKHYWFVAQRGSAGNFLFLNGRPLPEPLLRQDSGMPVFTTDEKRYAVATTVDANSQHGHLIVDGRVASYFGVRPQFLPNGKLLTYAQRDGTLRVLLDGRVLNPDHQLRDVKISANNRIAGIAGDGVWLDGRIVLARGANESIRSIVFSPDGKRLAVHGTSGVGQEWLWLDGKRSDNYQAIIPMGPINDRVSAVFSADSSVCIAIASNGGLRFTLVNGEESADGFQFVNDPILAPAGARYGYVVTFENSGSGVVVDGRMFASPEWRVGNALSRPSVLPDSLRFSPDGSRSTFVVGGPQPILFLDEEPVAFPEGFVPEPWLGSSFVQGDPMAVLFTANGRRAAYIAREKRSEVRQVLVDGRPIWTGQGSWRRNPTFTPDGRHLIWLNRERSESRKGMDMCVYVNGRRVLALPHDQQIFSDLQRYTGWAQVGEDGRFHVLSISDEGIFRHTITPSADFDLDAAIAAGPASGSDATGTMATALEPATATRVDAATVQAQPVRTVPAEPAVAAAPVEPLTWAQLVRKREAWPATAKINRELRFTDGATVRAGSEIAIVELKAREVVASANRGAITFAVEPEATDVLDVANAGWAALTPAQRDLTYAKLARSPELWPYEIKLSVPIELSGAPSQRAGSTVLFLGYDGNQLLVRIPKTNVAFNIEPENTDLFARARQTLADERGAPGRLLEEFAAAGLVDPATNRGVQLDLSARPQYVVLYMGAGWCPPCKVFAPKLVKTIKDKAPAADKVTFIFLSGDKTPAAAKQYLGGLGINWPMLTFTSRGQIPAFQTLFGDTIPQLVVTDRHGTVIVDSAKVGHDRALAQLAELL